ncbi:PREDICTED: protein TWIN SISTER of FT-like isoform X1 [Brassica oleracea var. oleracea]|uniref:protein TWIN SISTER of FT-like isoform X1 n=1 Tax=Brassica oleracea var. oleracea TaxID=109376 RepID=UPI0006A6BBF8|nr:PREDICTED: protein TWIN SISTER of FT-like isoform X1 [Brassica oleracea var. oleracea]
MSLSPRDPLVLARVVGDVVDPFMRLISLTVNYGQRQVTNGLDLRTSQVLNKPTVEIGGDDLRNLYTLVMVSRCAKSKQPSPPRISPLYIGLETLNDYSTSTSRAFKYAAKQYLKSLAKKNNIVNLNGCSHYRLVTDIPATTGTAFGNELVHYENPCPNSGIHRVALMLSRQLRRQTVYAPEWRQRFNTRAFAENNNLGLPVAAVFFNCQRDNGCGGRRT